RRVPAGDRPPHGRVPRLPEASLGRGLPQRGPVDSGDPGLLGQTHQCQCWVRAEILCWPDSSTKRLNGISPGAPIHPLRVESCGHNLMDPRSKTRRPTLDLTRKDFLTYIGNMVETPDREPDVFGAISHPARRRMLDLLVEGDRSVNTIAGHFQMSR